MITADAGWRRGKQIPLKANVDAALAKSPTVEKCVVYKRTGCDVTMQEGRDFWWHDLMAEASADCPAEPMDSEAPLFILYTSGSTGKPKGIKHTTAGYNLFAKKTMEWVFDIRDEDVYWCTADIGWITGHTLRRLRAADGRGDGLHVRGRARHAAPGPLVGDDREVQDQHPLHRPHGHPHLHQVGRRVGRQVRPLQPAAAWARWAKGSTPRPGCGITARSAASAARSSIPGGRPRRAGS